MKDFSGIILDVLLIVSFVICTYVVLTASDSIAAQKAELQKTVLEWCPNPNFDVYEFDVNRGGFVPRKIDLNFEVGVDGSKKVYG